MEETEDRLLACAALASTAVGTVVCGHRSEDPTSCAFTCSSTHSLVHLFFLILPTPVVTGYLLHPSPSCEFQE